MAPMVMATFSSSSTTRRLPFGMLRRAVDRQRDVENRAAAFAAAQFDRAAVRLNDALRDPQPESRALLFLGGEERLEDTRQVLFGDALARVAYLQLHRVRHEELRVDAAR